MGDGCSWGYAVMSDELKDALIINPAAGLKRVLDRAVSSLHPIAQEFWNRGVGNVADKVIRQNIVDRDFTVEDVAQRAAERIGILKPTKKTGGGDREYLRRKRSGDRKRR